MGLAQAGFDVIGVDIEPQPRYPFHFIQADAVQTDVDFVRMFDLVWASPPCQHYSMFSRNLGTAHKHPDLIPPARELLEASGRPFIIENVVGAPLRNPITLCGTMFGLKLIRHRLFETNWPVDPPTCCLHRGDEIPVYGNGTPQWHRKTWGRNISIAEKRAAMEIDWTNRDELSQAIPPAYSRFLAAQWLIQSRQQP